MKVLILGGSRFIGKRLAHDLVSAGHRVTLYNRGRASDGLGDRVERLRGDRGDTVELANALSGRAFDAAYDFLCYDAAGARLIVDALRERIGRLVHISTCSVYWCAPSYSCPVLEEEFDRYADFPRAPSSIEYDYGYAKRKAEEALFAAYRERGFPVTVARLPVVGGEGDHTLRYASYCVRVADGGPVVLPDGGHAPFRHLYVGDAARALVALATVPRAEGQAYNVAGHEILSVRFIVESIAALLGRRVECIEIPTEALQRLGLATEFSPFSQRAALVPAIFKARRDLGWEPTAYAVWLERAVRWAMEEGLPGARASVAGHRAQELQAAASYREAVGAIA